MAWHRSKPACSLNTRKKETDGPQPGSQGVAPPAATRRALAAIAALWLGYLLFGAVYLAEMSYRPPDRPNPDCLGMAAHWFHRALTFAPIRSFALGPGQRFSALGAEILTAAVVLLGLGYLGVLRAVHRHPEGGSLPRLLVGAGLAALPLLLFLPPTSVDYLSYLFGGRVAAVYHLNPWQHVLGEFVSEHNYLSPRVWGAGYQFIYGPVWALIMAAIAGIVQLAAPGRLTPESFLLSVMLLRAANIAALIAAAIAIWRINGRLWPRQQRLVTAAFLLNPLLVYEAVGALHNDIWGLMFLLWACDLFLRDDSRFLAPLVLSILTKFLALAFVPLLCVYYLRRAEWRRLGWLAFAMLVSLGLTWLTLTADLLSHLIASTTHLICSPTSMPLAIFCVLQMATGLPQDAQTVLTASRALTALYVPIYLVLLWRTYTREQVIGNGLWALALYLAGPYVQTMQWYFVWPLGLLCVLRWTRATTNLVWASGAVLLGYIHYFATHNGWSIPLLAVCFFLAVILPVLVCLAGCCGWWSALPRSATAEAEELPAPGPGGAGRKSGRATAVAPARRAVSRPGAVAGRPRA